MKKSYTLLCFILMLICSPQLSQASTTNKDTKLEQIINQATVSISLKNAELGTILKKINKLTGVDYAYEMGQNIDSEAIYSLDVKDTKLSNALNTLFAKGDYTYRIFDEKILVTRKAIPQSTAAASQQQPIKIEGVVLSEDGALVIGATVIATSGKGTITNNKGQFSLTLPAACEVEFSSVGFVTKTVKFTKSDSDINITLIADVLVADDVVVTGIFTKPRESYTGAVTTISAKEIKAFKGQNLLRTLANIDPALNIAVDNAAGSDPNNIPNLTIRGTSSLPTTLDDLGTDAAAQLNTPLVIMDGFEVSLETLMDFNDDEIESINILKDASSTALYGSRGANGVIVIVTKQPEAGKLNINFTASLNIEMPDLTSYNLMNATEKLEVERRAGLYSSTSLLDQIEMNGYYNDILTNIMRGVETDWISQPVRVGTGQTYSLRVDGGSGEFRWSGSANYNNTQGVMKTSSRETLNAALNFIYTRKNFIFRNQTTISSTVSDNGTYGSFSSYADMNPYWTIYDDEGYINETFDHVAETKPIGNPLYNATLNTISQSNSSSLTNNFSVSWNILEGLRAEAKLGLTKGFGSSDYFLPASHTFFSTIEDPTQRGLYNYSTSEKSSLTSELAVNYSKTIGKHQIYAGLNASLYSNTSESVSLSVAGFTNDNLSYLQTGLAYSGSNPGGTESTARKVGLVANVNYTYNEGFFVDGSYRVDGSSQFGSNNRFAPFWSIGAGWNLHKEKFIEDLNFFETLRVRLSRGHSGSQQFSAYQAMQTLEYYTDQVYVMWNGASLMALGNEDLKWQTTAQTNFGIDANFLNRRMNVSFDVYNKTTFDLLSSLNLQPSSGFVNYVENVGEVQNKGFELSVGGDILRNLKQGIRWNVTARIAHNKDEITKLSDDIKAQTLENLTNNNEYANMLYEGDSQNAIYAVTSVGIDPSTGKELYLDRNGDITDKWVSSNKVYQGVSQPTFRGNINSVLTYKDFSLNLSFGYYWGGSQYNSTLINKVEVTTNSLSSNVDKRVLYERWYTPGDIVYFKALSNETTKMTSRFIMDDNVFTLQNASLSYRLMLKDFYFKTVNLGVNMSDLFYISSIDRERGTSYPFSRRISLSAAIMF